MLNIQGLDCHLTQEKVDAYTVEVKAAWHDFTDICSSCSSLKMIRFGIRTRKFQDLPMHGKKVEIIYHLRRFRCQECGVVTTEEVHSDMDVKRSTTRRFLQYVIRQSPHRTFTSLAIELGVDEKTIRNIVNDFHSKHSELPVVPAPRILGIDEVHLVKKMRCVITNIEDARLYDMLEVRSQRAVTNFLIRMPERKNVEVVCMDMYAPYKRAANFAFKDATVVVDKFHVLKYANTAMEDVRKRLRELPKPARRLLKRERYVLLKRPHRLKPFEHLNLQVWSSNFPELGSAYKAKEEFFQVYDATDRQEAEERYVEWLSKLPPSIEWAFQPLLTAVSNWHHEIFNYFDQRYTNATTEALNGLIKVANRTGRGYTFNTLRNKILARNYPSITTLKDEFEKGAFLS